MDQREISPRDPLTESDEAQESSGCGECDFRARTAGLQSLLLGPLLAGWPRTKLLPSLRLPCLPGLCCSSEGGLAIGSSSDAVRARL